MGRVGDPLICPRWQTAKLDSTDGRLDLRHALVETDNFVNVACLHALTPEEAGSARQVRIRGGDHSALSGGHVLGWIERKRPKCSKRSDWLPVDGGSVCLGSVFYQGQPTLVAQGDEFLHRSGMAVKMDRHNRYRAARDQRFHKIGRD